MGLPLSTAGVARQDAVIGEDIPFLSRIFLESGFNKKKIIS